MKESKVLNLYVICDRQETVAFIVAAKGPERGLELIVQAGMEGWSLATTRTRRILRNIGGEAEILSAVSLKAKTGFRRVAGRSHESAARRRKGKSLCADTIAEIEADRCNLKRALRWHLEYTGTPVEDIPIEHIETCQAARGRLREMADQ